MAELLLEERPAAAGVPTYHAAPSGPPITLIQPSAGWRSLGLGELWRYRELVYFLAMRDVKVRYRQTFLGVLWAILQPLFTMVVFSVIFGRLAKIPSDGIPYPIFAYCGLLPWQLFATAMGNASNSLVGAQHLITKIYFPRLVIPLSSVLTAVVDFALAFLVLVGLMVYYGIAPTPAVVVLPFLLLLAAVSALGVGLWLSALNVRYRDVRYTVPFLVQVWLYATPVAYPASLVPEQWRPLFGLNPMAGVVEGFRWALLGGTFEPGPLIAVSVGMALALLASGLFFFRRMERTFADVV